MKELPDRSEDVVGQALESDVVGRAAKPKPLIRRNWTT